MYRLFVAIDLSAEAKEAIFALRTPLPGAKWVAADQLHVTLRFIGDADEVLFHKIRDTLAGIIVPSFSLNLRGVGYFPPKRDPRVLWVGLERNENLLVLRNLVEKALLACGLEPEGRSFSPHITIARLKDVSKAVISPFLHKNALFATPSFLVEEFVLYSSTLAPQGATHRQEALYPLRK
ncbi:MAG: RNA 2',3'-cyclic phosphodiesterase [Deltaproteobacteria bacterium]|nr:RNA 2',3'-cyclic phosphodiesterase [Deltaproteobacteria bacterium]